MKTNKLILMCAALVAGSMANLSMTHAQSPAETPNKDALITWTATGKQSGKVDVLFVQNAKGRNVCGGKARPARSKPGDRVLH